MNIDINKSLDELEGTTWGEPDFQSSLTLRCHELRKKKLKDFSAGDLRVMIGQKISIEYLVPLALETLVTNPFVAGDIYHGDLLIQVLEIDKQFWNQNGDLSFELKEVISIAKETLETISPFIRDFNLTD